MTLLQDQLQEFNSRVNEIVETTKKNRWEYISNAPLNPQFLAPNLFSSVNHLKSAVLDALETAKLNSPNYVYSIFGEQYYQDVSRIQNAIYRWNHNIVCLIVFDDRPFNSINSFTTEIKDTKDEKTGLYRIDAIRAGRISQRKGDIKRNYFHLDFVNFQHFVYSSTDKRFNQRYLDTYAEVMVPIIELINRPIKVDLEPSVYKRPKLADITSKLLGQSS